mgnify:CR=1 FL=1
MTSDELAALKGMLVANPFDFTIPAQEVRAQFNGAVATFPVNEALSFTDKTIDILLSRLEPLRRATSPFPEVPKMPKVRRSDIVWVRPELVAEVEFVEWTHDGHLRAPSFQGLRDDKPADPELTVAPGGSQATVRPSRTFSAPQTTCNGLPSPESTVSTCNLSAWGCFSAVSTLATVKPLSFSAGFSMPSTSRPMRLRTSAAS